MIEHYVRTINISFCQKMQGLFPRWFFFPFFKTIDSNATRDTCRGGREKDVLTETKLPEVSTANFLADPEVRADHEHAGRRGDAVPGRVHVRPGGVGAAPGGPFGDLLVALLSARPELLVAAVVPAFPLLHFVPAVVIHGCGNLIIDTRSNCAHTIFSPHTRNVDVDVDDDVVNFGGQ